VDGRPLQTRATNPRTAPWLGRLRSDATTSNQDDESVVFRQQTVANKKQSIVSRRLVSMVRSKP